MDTKTNLDIDKFYFVNDTNYNSFLVDITNKKIVYYYGLIKNKKIIADGSNLKEKSTCYGTIVNSIHNNYANEETNIQPKIVDFSYYNFENEDVLLNFDKAVIVFIYSYKSGKLTNTLEDLINDIKQNINIDYVILSLDTNDIN